MLDFRSPRRAAGLPFSLPMGLPAVVAAALAALLAVEMLVPWTPVAPAVALRKPPAPAMAAPPADPAVAQATILARPLFRPDRRPLRAAPPATDETVPRLSAIVITGAGRSAIFIDDSGSAAILRPGGRIGAYQVQSIAPDSVRLLGPNGAIGVYPSFAAAVATPAPAAPPPPPPFGLFSNVPQ